VQFDADGAVFTIVVNHFKSKGSTCGEPSEGADGQGNCNLQRVLEANALLGFVGDLESIHPDVLVIGDFNAYTEEDPIHALEADLMNLDEGDPYSYNFFDVANAAPYIGRGALDHGLEPLQQLGGLAAFAMGEAGQISRILAPLAGGYFTYASLEEGKESAAGQLTADQLREIYGILEDDR